MPIPFAARRNLPPLKAAGPLGFCVRILSSAALLWLSSAMAKEATHAEAVLPVSTSRFQPVDIAVDLSRLPDNERQALAQLVSAARVMDTLFLRQVWAGNEPLLLELLRDKSPLGEKRLHAFLLEKGPWSTLDHNAPFISGVPAKPAKANFYPAHATKSEVEVWRASLPEPERSQSAGFFSVIRRDENGNFFSLPYSVEYQNELALASERLLRAASLTHQASLRAFLEKRAAAFLSNDYYESDLAWMALDSSIEPTIGPYEVYEDEWFNHKAAFEAFVTVRDDKETAKLAKFGAELQDIENHLPIEPGLRNPKLGALAPIRVVNSVFSAGNGNRGVQTAAFNLPNDERITEEHGAKRTMLKNIQEAKFKAVLLPIAKVALSKADQADVSFDAFFTHILMHELMHGLGPHNISVGGKRVTVRSAMEELYSPLEEAKADISGLFALQYLIDKDVVEKSLEKTLYVTFLASAFRSIRFGLNEAHGKGIALQLNVLLDAGAFNVHPDGTFSVDHAKIKDAVRGLTGELMTLQAKGDQAGVKALFDRQANLRLEVKRVLDRLKDVPVDIEPKYVTAEEFL